MLRKTILFPLLILAFVEVLLPRSNPMQLEPKLDYLNHIGGKARDLGTTVAVDPFGNVYVGGMTNSPKFSNSQQRFCKGSRLCGDHAFLVKLDTSGRKQLFSTSISENKEILTGIATDKQGSVYVCTQSLAMTPGAGFAAKYDSTGKQIYKTELQVRKHAAPEGIAVDASGNVYVTGWTIDENYLSPSPSRQQMMNPMQWVLNRTFKNAERSNDQFSDKYSGLLISNFSGSAGEKDAFLIELDPSGRIVNKLTISGSGDDVAYAISLDHAGRACITGSTTSWDFPEVNKVQLPGPVSNRKNNALDSDLFVAKVDLANSRIIFSSVFGGGSADVGYAISLDGGDNLYVAGGTASPDFPMKNPAQRSMAGSADAFILKFDQDGSRLDFSTYLGGGRLDVVLSMALDSEANIYVAGTIMSPDFRIKKSDSDFFIAKLDTAGRPIFNKKFGSRKNEKAIGIALDGSGRIYVIGSSSKSTLGKLGFLRIGLYMFTGAAWGGYDTSDAFLARFE
jgi:large repetitive protein